VAVVLSRGSVALPVVHRPPVGRHKEGGRPYNSGVARRPLPPDPELAALARDRLVRVLGGDPAGPRRAAALREERDADGDGDDRVRLDDLEPPRRFTRWHLGVVAVVLLVGLVWGAWSWVRARPEAVAAPTAVQTASIPAASGAASPSPSSGPPPPSTAGQTAGPVVHVLGAVRHPGLVRLAVGARVEDAIEAAGGLRSNADPDELNLAQPLEDGVQVVVGTRAHPAGEVRSGSGSGGGGGSAGAGSGGSAGSAGSTAAGASVDLNRAGVEQLDSLPGVGPVTAQKILDWRQEHGRFSRTEELQEVDGIGPKTYARIAPHVRV
jgi:competence protein ComEA